MPNITKIKQDFPIFGRKVNGKPLVYLDSAATTQKPWRVCEEMDVYYCHSNANVHRGVYTLAEESTKMYEDARAEVQSFIGAKSSSEIVFTRNTTESINLIAESYARTRLKSGDEIVLTEMEHHANLLPWQRVARQTGAKLVFIPVTPEGELDSSWSQFITDKTKIVSFCHISNVLGTINPAADLIKATASVGAISVVDAAQSVPHGPVDVSQLQPDFLVFSGHKMLGPTGIGVLYGRQELLADMEPFMVGGDMIAEVSYQSASWRDLPWKFEAGTPNIAGAIGLAKAIEYLEGIGREKIASHEQKLTQAAIAGLIDLGGVTVYGPTYPQNRSGIVSFTVDGVHAHDLASLLDQDGIAIRAGHHCVQPLVKKMGVPALARASFYLYNDVSDVELLVKSIKRAKKVFQKGSA